MWIDGSQCNKQESLINNGPEIPLAAASQSAMFADHTSTDSAQGVGMTAPRYPFFSRLARIFNSGQSRCIVLHGNIHDLFWNGAKYVPLISFLKEKSEIPGIIRLVYERNGPIRVAPRDYERLRDAWVSWKTGLDTDSLILSDLTRREDQLQRRRTEYDNLIHGSISNATQAFEFLRQLTICSRLLLRENLMIVIEAADMLVPADQGNIAQLSDAHLRRISIISDWFSDPEFMAGRDSVCFVAESRSQIHSRIAMLPQLLDIEVPAPSTEARLHFIQHFQETSTAKAKLWAEPSNLADFSAGLSMHALRQLLVESAYVEHVMQPSDVIAMVQQYIQGQLGEDVVEFKKPSHRLAQVVGFSQLKTFLAEKMIPRLKMKGDAALPGAAVAGPIGGGKTFIFEALAAELDLPVLVLKSIRSQWFGQTDVIFERLRRVLESLEKVVIFVDEADTQFGGVGAGAHETERRLTGKIQAMMSDPRLRGQVIWLLMTARIHLLSPDIRRPGRVGDLIIPILDPRDDDRRAFIRWVLGATTLDGDESLVELLDRDILSQDFSAAAFASLRSQLKAEPPTDREALIALIHDHLPPAIEQTRRYQTLQALVNCTRRSLLPDPEVSDQQRANWEHEIRQLEREGIH